MRLGLRFVARAACAMPHPEKTFRGGEDGFFLSPEGRAMGVADGVGGWADSGVNPAFFTWTFMQRCLHHATPPNGALAPPLKDVLMSAWSDTVKSRLLGSCTTAVVAFDSEGSPSDATAPLSVGLVGDCAVLIVRDGNVVLRTKEQQYKFNFPHQIGSDGGSGPNRLAAYEEVSVQPKDIVVLGSDGVFDNVFDKELLDLISKAQGTANAKKASAIDCQQLADSIAQLATDHGASEQYNSPFAVAASKAGYRYMGGKQDDVCVVVGVVGREDIADGKPPYETVEGYLKWAKKPCAPMPTTPGSKL